MSEKRVVELHRHDEFSHDGFGKAMQVAEWARDNNYLALGITNHGTTSGNIQHYIACKQNDIIPILGYEAYVVEDLQKHREDRKANPSYHLNLYALNQVGYTNLNILATLAEANKYYKPLLTLSLLSKHSKGIACTTSCISGYISSMIVDNQLEKAEQYLKKLIHIYKHNIYMEVQPYPLYIDGQDATPNLIKNQIALAKKYNISVISTTDSHYYNRKDNWQSFSIYHDIKVYSVNYKDDYEARHLPTQRQKQNNNEKYYPNLNTITQQGEAKFVKQVDVGYLSDLPVELPEVQFNVGLKQLCFTGLSNRQVQQHSLSIYQARLEHELEVIISLGFESYFLIVHNYVNWAKQNQIKVGYGRGSVCCCLVAYLLGITNTDPVEHNLKFERFLHEGKKKMPDIDVDFEKSKRHLVIDYICTKYKGKAAKISNYSTYNIDGVINDLSKHCTLSQLKEDPNHKANKTTIEAIKQHIHAYVQEDGKLDTEALLSNPKTRLYNNQYNNIITHATKLYRQVRQLGTHASGIALCKNHIMHKTALRLDKDNQWVTVHDLSDLEAIGVVKLDILGLNTLDILSQLEWLTGKSYKPSWCYDKNVIKLFRDGNTLGIFQFDARQVRDLLKQINPKNFNEVMATNALNRPGALSQKSHEQYANSEAREDNLIYEYVKDTRGCLIYQEQILDICTNLAGMSNTQADRVLKLIGAHSSNPDAELKYNQERDELCNIFVQGIQANKALITKYKGYPTILSQLKDKKYLQNLFYSFQVYLFNKGHACGYTILSICEAYYKVYHPLEFWVTKIKLEAQRDKVHEYYHNAVMSNVYILPPNLNGVATTSIVTYDKTKVIQLGLDIILGMGTKASQYIANHAPYCDEVDFEDKIAEGKAKKDYEGTFPVNTKIIQIIKDNNLFDTLSQSQYDKEIQKFNKRLIY